MVSFRGSHAQISILLGNSLVFWETAHHLPTTYPAPKLTLTRTSHLGQNDGLGEG